MKLKTFVICVLVQLLPPLMASKASAVSCSGSFGTLNLGSYSGMASPTSTTIGSITCPRNFGYGIGLSAGHGSGATVTLRKMTGQNSTTLNYQIFQDSARTTNWGNTNNVDTKFVVGSGNGQGVTVHTLIPAGQLVAPGTYQDSVAVSAFNSSPLSVFTMPVVAVVSASCVLSATSLAFGNYSGVQNDSTATITVTCTNTTPYYVNLNSGLQQDSSNYPRMKGPGSDLLSYRLFQNAARTVAWQNTVNVNGEAGTGNGTSQQLTVYGRVVAGQKIRPGAYVDTVVATISY